MFTSPLPPFTRFQGAPCPYCGGATLCPSPQRLTHLIELTEQEEAVLEFLWDQAGRPEGNGKAANFEIAASIFDEEEDVGPWDGKANRAVRGAIAGLRYKLRSLGYIIKATYRKKPKGRGRQEHRRWLGLAPDPTAPVVPRSQPAGKSGGFRRQFRPVPCRCCGRQISCPTIEQVMAAHDLQPRERQVIRIIDGTYGRVASNEWLIKCMFADDPNPKDWTQKYSALKVAISYARAKLKGSGLSIEPVGYRQGFMLTDEVSR